MIVNVGVVKSQLLKRYKIISKVSIRAEEIFSLLKNSALKTAEDNSEDEKAFKEEPSELTTSRKTTARMYEH